MLYSIITTIQEPTDCVNRLVDRLNHCAGTLVVAGDSKGPQSFDGPEEAPWPVEFLSLAAQESAGFSLAANLPTKHYARKNIAYLHAIRSGATCIYETDDDNAPNGGWAPREEVISDCRILEKSDPRWVNVYGYFSDENIWPRGLPLDEIRQKLPLTHSADRSRRAPVQQGLVDGSPDVDAIWRLVMDREFRFDQVKSVHLEPGNWCPFNTQSTWHVGPNAFHIDHGIHLRATQSTIRANVHWQGLQPGIRFRWLIKVHDPLLRDAVQANDQVVVDDVQLVVSIAARDEHVPRDRALRLEELVPLPGLLEVDDQDEVYVRGGVRRSRSSCPGRRRRGSCRAS